MGKMRRGVLRSVAIVGVVAVALAGTLTAGPAFAGLFPNKPPTAVATASPNPAHAGQVVHLFGTGSSDPETAPADLLYAWSFGDGTSAAGAKTNFAIDHTYPLAGVYTASLTVTDPDGASATAKVVIEVDDTAPIASATATPTAALAGQQVQFDGSGSHDAETATANLTYLWDFKDGTPAGSGMKPTHAYTSAGTYAVLLTVTDPQGAAATATVTVKVTNTAPVAAWTLSPAAPHAGQVVTFTGSTSTDAETPNALTYDWDFGDGSVHATTAIATHTYATAGYKTIKLKVTDPQGLTNTKSTSVSVTANKAPVAVATATRSKANLGQVVGFDGSGSSDAETPNNQLVFSWDFGNGGSTEDATGATASYGFTAPGIYTVTLKVTDTNNLSSTDKVVVTVGNTAPVASLTATPTPAYALQSVAFNGTASTDAETPDQLTYSWTYGDGAAATAFGANAQPTHVYATAGTYTVTLKVKDAEGSIGTKTLSLVVNPNGRPTAVPVATPNPAHVGKSVSFTSAGSSDPDGNPLTYLWTFPGGATATTATATQTFAAVGSYTVTLKVTDTRGVSGTAEVTVNVTNGAPVASAHATPNPAHVGKSVSLTSTGSGDPDGDTVTYQWALPGGVTANTATTAFTFASVGTHPVTLTVTDQYGATATSTVTVNVTNGAPVASAHATPNPAHLDKPVSFTSTGSSDPDGDTLTYLWTFPGGATADTAATQHTFDAVGNYPVTLKVTDQYGATATSTVTVSVTNVAPVASAHATPNPVHVDQSVTFTSTGSTDPDGDTLTYQWAFPGGVTASTATATHAFPAVGNFSVTLTVTDQYGLSDTDTLTVSVGNAAPVAAAQATPNPAHVGDPVSFTSTGSSDPEGDSVTYHWAFPGGATANTAATQRTFAAVGSYQVILTVTDQYGLTDTDTVTVNVTNAAPVAAAAATPNPAHVGETVSFTSAGSSDPDGDTVTYHWAFPGGATADTATASQVFTAAGSYVATLTVTDEFGATTSKSVTVVVTNDAPVASFTNTGGLLVVKQAVGFDARGSKDTENGAQLTYAWNFGDGTTGTGATPKHAFTKGGSFLVKLTTKDPQGKTGTATRVVDVARVLSCQNSSVTRTKQWRSAKNAAATGGSYCDNGRGGTLGGNLQLRASGSRFGLTFGKSTTGGSAEVYIDGVLKGTVSFRTSGATTFGNRKVFTGLGAGTHRIKVKMVRGVGYVDDFLVFGP